MANKNRFECIGRLARDPEFGVTKSKMAYCRLSIATTRKYKSSGDKKEETFFINATAWGQKAEFINEYTSKGHLVYVEGPLTNNRWEDKEGNKRSDIVLMIDDIQLLEKKFKEPAEKTE